MLTLGELTALLLAVATCAWLWHAHGVHEHALRLVREACRREDVLLLDDNVAFRRLRLLRDRHGRRRLAREYAFEFTVTGEQRQGGRILLLGRVPAQIELAPHRFHAPVASTAAQTLDAQPVVDSEERPSPPPDAAEPRRSRVVNLDDWRRRRPPPG